MSDDLATIRKLHSSCTEDVCQQHSLRDLHTDEISIPVPCHVFTLLPVVDAAEGWRGQWVPAVPDGASVPQDMALIRAVDALRASHE